MYKKVLEKINNNTAQICVIGLGQVGLPVALSFCKAEFIVKGLDNNKIETKWWQRSNVVWKLSDVKLNERNVSTPFDLSIDDPKKIWFLCVE